MALRGLGRRSILSKVIERCHENNVPYIQVNASNNTDELLLTIAEEGRKYALASVFQKSDEDFFSQSVNVTSTILEQGPLVMLLDAIDVTNEDQLEQVEHLLGELIVYNKLFVILTSRRSITFEHERSVARKMIPYAVQPFDRDSCELYLNAITFQLSPELRECIFEWTRGYPLAMNIMVDAIARQGFNPLQVSDQQPLVDILFERVVIRGLLSTVQPEEYGWFQRALTLLAVPRRFNLVIMQKLIEEFEPDMKLPNSLAYIVLPKRIGQATGVLGWNLDRAGYSIDDPVRNILLLYLKITTPERYVAISQFLVELNWKNALEVTGSDRIRYQREYLYHSVAGAGQEQLPQIVEQTVQLIIQDAQAKPDQLVQFAEEFDQDSELQTALEPHTSIAQDLIYSELAQRMNELAITEKDKEKRKQYLQSFFLYTLRIPDIRKKPDLLNEQISALISREDPLLVKELYDVLGKNDVFREVLGDEFLSGGRKLMRMPDQKGGNEMFDEQKNFIGHTREIELFEQWLAETSPDGPWILYLYDATDEQGRKGGVGKTWLLKKFAALIQERYSDIAIVMVDFFSVLDRDAVVIAERIVASIASIYTDWEPSAFNQAMLEYQQVLVKNSDQSEAQDTIYEALSNDLISLSAFLQGEGKKLVLFFDTFEVIEAYPVTAILGSNHTFPEHFEFPYIGAIIAGRNALDWQHANWLGREAEVRTHAVEPFNLDEMVQFINEYCIFSISRDSEEARILHTRTYGRPILVGLVIDLLNHHIMTLPQLLDTRPEGFEQYLVLQINSLERPINWVILFMAHVYHRFDESILRWLFERSQELVNAADPTLLAKKLLELSFVRYSGTSDNLALHDEMRRLVNTYNWSALGSETQGYRLILSQAMVEYYDKKLREAENQQLVQAYKVEQVYHELMLSPDGNFEFFADMMKGAIDLWQTAFARALFQEASKFQERLPRDLRLRLRRYEALLLRKEENAAAALAIYEELEQDAGQDWLSDHSRRMEILYDKGYCYLNLNRFAEAVACFHECLAFERSRNNKRREANILNRLGYIARRIGEYDEVESYFLQCQTLYKNLGDRRLLADTFNSLGNIYRLRGKLDEALRYCTTSWRMRKELYDQGRGSEVVIGSSLSTMGSVYLRLNDLVQAQECFERAYEIFERNRYRKGTCVICNRFGQVAMGQNNLSLAMEWFRKGYQKSLGIDTEAEITSLNRQGRVLVIQEKLSEAVPLFERVIQRAQEVRDYYQQTEALIDLADIFLRQQQYKPAFGKLHDAEEIASRYHYYFLLGRIEQLYGDYPPRVDHRASFEHYGKLCSYMFLYNPLEYANAVRYTTEVLQRLPIEDMRVCIQLLSTYWNSLNLQEKESSLLKSLEEVSLLMDI